MIVFYLDIDYDIEHNQENIKPIEPNCICPRMKSSKTPNTKLNWNTIQCITRIQENNRCTFRCEIAKKLKKGEIFAGHDRTK